MKIQIEKTAEELIKNGVEIVFYDPWKNQIPEVDLCHVFSLDGSLVYHVQKAAMIGKPIVISPVLNCFRDSLLQTVLKVRLSSHIPGMYSDYKRAQLMLSDAVRVIVLNHEEKNVICKAFKFSQQNCIIVPNGINKTFASANPKLFENKYGVRNFILNVASIEQRKNQLNLIKAVKKLNYKLVIIGEATFTSQYYLEECRAIASDNVVFVGPLTYEDPLLASAFAAAKLFVLPSYSEVMPLTLYEAAVAGCKLITSRNVPISDQIKEYVQVVNSDKPKDIAVLIDKEMKSPVNENLREAALAMPSWYDVGKKIKTIYDDIILNK
ncbi:MAG: glycosyltransferase family 4 protein [Bacteroidia bacterium]|nr:glycosyltransferase family 4 protein [Bacteroidia bacterium]